MYYTYIIYSESSDRYYVGSTADLNARLGKHNQGGTPSTRPYRPWRLVYSEEFTSKTSALKREREIKRQKSRQYIERLFGANC